MLALFTESEPSKPVTEYVKVLIGWVTNPAWLLTAIVNGAEVMFACPIAVLLVNT